MQGKCSNARILLRPQVSIFSSFYFKGQVAGLESTQTPPLPSVSGFPFRSPALERITCPLPMQGAPSSHGSPAGTGAGDPHPVPPPLILPSRDQATEWGQFRSFSGPMPPQSRGLPGRCLRALRTQGDRPEQGLKVGSRRDGGTQAHFSRSST